MTASKVEMVGNGEIYIAVHITRFSDMLLYTVVFTWRQSPEEHRHQLVKELKK
jgi:hypothetical protein